MFHIKRNKQRIFNMYLRNKCDSFDYDNANFKMKQFINSILLFKRNTYYVYLSNNNILMTHKLIKDAFVCFPII